MPEVPAGGPGPDGRRGRRPPGRAGRRLPGRASDLEDYTDRGDACPQAVSAIGYADDALRPLGQEPYQEFDDAVRSRLSAVEGTLSLEARDWPDRETAEQARRVQALAADAASDTDGPQRERALLEYRIEAARLVLACRDATG